MRSIRERILALLLALVMVVGVLPVSAFAAGETFEPGKAIDAAAFFSDLHIKSTTSGGMAEKGTLLIACGLSGIAYLRGYAHGLWMLFLALMIAWMSDIGAYFTGSFFGKHKLCPKISPKKTVEGFVGGIVFSVVICTLYGWIYRSDVYKKIS